MKLIWHSHNPEAKTGYGTPTALWASKLREMGYEVVLSAFEHPTPPPQYWKGIRVHHTYDAAYGAHSLDAIARHERADLIITLMDAWAMPATALNSVPCPVINWIPVDTYPLGNLDRQYFAQSKGIPVAMSEYGGRMLAEAGFKDLSVPYAYDPDAFNPGSRRKADGTFRVGINASNVERKAWPEQLSAYARLWENHPGEVLLLANTNGNGPIQFDALIQSLGLPPEAIQWSTTGQMDDMADWYRSLDVLSSCSLAEGFCLPVVEAQACGTPVIVTDAPPLSTETGVPGRYAFCEPVWSQMHQAWWHRPSIEGIHEQMEDAFRDQGNPLPRTHAAGYAKRYAIDAVAPQWAAIINAIGSGE